MRHHIPCLAAALLAANAFAVPPPETAQTNGLETIRSLPMPDLQALTYTGPQEAFSQEYIRRIERNAKPILSSRIGYPAGFQSFIDSLHHGGEWNETAAHNGGRAVKSLLGDELRDTLAGRINIHIETLIPEPDNRFLDWLWRNSVGFLDNSLAHSSEGRQRLTVYSSEEDLIGYESWQQGHPHGWIPRLGLRPIGTRPNVYLESNAGRQSGGLPLMYFDLRGYTDLESLDHFGRFKAEAIARFPVDHLFQLTIGFSGYPMEVGDQKWGEVIRIDCPVKALRGIVSVGAHHNDRQDRILAQFNMTF